MAKELRKVKNYTVVQANDLIRSKKDFSLWELRVFALLASHVRKEDDDFLTYKFRIRDLLDLFETKSNNLYEELRAIPEKLHAKLIKLPYVDDNGKKRVRRYNLVSMSDFPEGEEVDEGEYIMLRFDKDLKPLMLKLGEHFTVYKFYNILKLRSPYIFQLYELLKSEEYKGNGKITILMEELRDILQIPESYKFGNIKQRILEPAKKQFKEHTDIVFEYTSVKGKGGKITKLRFAISKNTKTPSRQVEEGEKEASTSPQSIMPAAHVPLFEELYPKISEWIGEGTFKKMLLEYSETQIRTAIRMTLAKLKKGAKIENVGGYIVTLAKQTTLFDPEQSKVDKQEARKQRRREEEQRRDELEQQKKTLQAEYHGKIRTVVDALFLEFPDLRDELYEEVSANTFSGFDRKKSKEENLASPLFQAAFNSAVKKRFPERFEAIEQYFKPKLKSIDTAISMI